MEPFGDRPRIFYGERGDSCESSYPSSDNCEELSPEELNQIQTLISERTKKPIWFVRVPLASSQRYRSQLWVYLPPDTANTRLRSGWAYTIDSLHTSRKSYLSPPWRYVQVSLPDKMFDPVLETPEVCDLPFPYPSRGVDGSEGRREHLSQEELISIVDYGRKPDVYLEFEDHRVVSSEHLPGGGTRYRTFLLIPPGETMAEIAVSQPVIGIRKDADETTVTFGFVHHGLFARGYSVRMRMTEQGYKLIGWNCWVS